MRRSPVFGARGSVLGLTVALGAAGCGGENTPPPKVAEKAPVVTTAPPKAVVAQPGQKTGITMAGASELSGDAKAAYQRGFDAWMSGDLKAAKDAFADAASKAPGAG